MNSGIVWGSTRFVLALVLTVLTVAIPTLAGAQAFKPPAPSAQAAKGSKASAKPVAAGPAVPAADSGQLFVAVMDLDGVGATKIEASAITDRLREELLKTGKFTIVERGQMDAVLNEQALQQTGCTSQECAVQVGKVLGVRDLIAGKVTKISDTQWQVNVTMTDVETSQALRAESLRYRGDYFSMLDQAMGLLAAKLAAPPGTLPGGNETSASQQQGQPAQDGKTSSSKWWWIAGGVAAAAAVAAASGSKSGSKGNSGSSCTTCGNLGVSW